MDNDAIDILAAYRKELDRLRAAVLDMRVALEEIKLERLPEIYGRKENAFHSLQALETQEALWKAVSRENRQPFVEMIDEILSIEDENRQIIETLLANVKKEHALVQKQRHKYQVYLRSAKNVEEKELNIIS